MTSMPDSRRGSAVSTTEPPPYKVPASAIIAGSEHRSPGFLALRWRLEVVLEPEQNPGLIARIFGVLWGVLGLILSVVVVGISRIFPSPPATLITRDYRARLPASRPRYSRLLSSPYSKPVPLEKSDPTEFNSFTSTSTLRSDASADILSAPAPNAHIAFTQLIKKQNAEAEPSVESSSPTHPKSSKISRSVTAPPALSLVQDESDAAELVTPEKAALKHSGPTADELPFVEPRTAEQKGGKLRAGLRSVFRRKSRASSKSRPSTAKPSEAPPTPPHTSVELDSEAMPTPSKASALAASQPPSTLIAPSMSAVSPSPATTPLPPVESPSRPSTSTLSPSSQPMSRNNSQQSPRPPVSAAKRPSFFSSSRPTSSSSKTPPLRTRYTYNFEHGEGDDESLRMTSVSVLSAYGREPEEKKTPSDPSTAVIITPSRPTTQSIPSRSSSRSSMCHRAPSSIRPTSSRKVSDSTPTPTPTSKSALSPPISQSRPGSPSPSSNNRRHSMPPPKKTRRSLDKDKNSKQYKETPTKPTKSRAISSSQIQTDDERGHRHRRAASTEEPVMVPQVPQVRKKRFSIL